MDINGFREAQSPWFFTQPPTYLVETRAVAAVVPTKTTAPTQDSRFPGWAAPMEDGRLLTDYRSQSQLNIPAGMQYATTRFMQRNATEIMETARKRQATAVGAGLPYDSVTEMPPAGYVSCTPFQCEVARGSAKGVGIVRREPVPELFGTFSPSRPSMFNPAKPLGTRVEEGGRNTVRGIY